MMPIFLLMLKTWPILLLSTMLPEIRTQPDQCQQPCQNRGDCVITQEGPKCLCLSGWEGRFCEKEKNECESSPCKNGGNCTDLFDGFQCNCTSSYTGPTCSQDVDECSQTPKLCKNGASCGNVNGGFNCSCVPGYTGPLCETEIDECATSPCHFGGTCTDLINNFRCECLPGFLGATCEAVVRQCQLTTPCGKNGICVEKPQGGYQCFCKPGYNGDHCESLVNLCVSRPCRNGATCVNNGVNYTCTCAPGFTGSSCETDINDCADSPCLHNGTCTEIVPPGFTCQCLEGFQGSRCETDINDCESSPCQGRQTCIDQVNGHKCECPLGTTGPLCETDVFDCRLTFCVNGGTCSKQDEAHVCICPPPYTDATCATSLDPCIPNPCLQGGSCYRVNETEFGCACSDGFIGQRCEGDIYDCLSNPCLNGGTCEEILYDGDVGHNSNVGNTQTEPGGSPSSGRTKFVCLCPKNFTGTLCESEFLACLSSPCKNGATCISRTTTDYTCECMDGWSGNQCDKDINECLATSPMCLNDGQCINKLPGFSCVCPQQLTGKHCDVDLLECSDITCLNGGTCAENAGKSPYCICSPGYTGADCSVKLSSCMPNPCHHNATCQDVSVSNGTDGSQDSDRQNVTCHCVPGFTGQLCEANVDECTILKPCLNNATCLDGINGYICQCQPGWTGLTCDTNIDDCASKPCQNSGNCTDLIDGFHCKCDFGYAGTTCSNEVNECIYEPCRNNATCIDLVNGFTCECLPGYTGVACSKDIDDCASSHCAGSATCVDGINTFTCLCPPGFQGVLCDEDIEECSSSPCKHGGTCTEPAVSLFSCLCPPGVQGDTCDVVSAANFDGRMALTFPSLAQISNGDASRRKRAATEFAIGTGQTQLQFTVTTTVLNGILLVLTGTSNSGHPQHVVLELSDSVLHFSASNGLQLLRDSIALTDENLGVHSQTVQVTIADIALDLRLNPTTCSSSDGGCLSAQLLFSNVTNWNLSGAVHFGGVADFTPYLRNLVQDNGGFVGCLGNLVINGQLVNLADADQFTLDHNSDGLAPEYGCPTHSPCLESACANGGTCQDLWVNKTCDCVPGFSGPTCLFQNMAHFETDNMLHFEASLVITEISFFFTAASTAGLIMYTVTMDSLSFSLDSGQLLMHLILNTSGNTLTSKVGSNLYLQDWVRVHFQVSNTTYTLEVFSNTTSSLGSISGTAGDVIQVTGSLFWGALLENSVTDKWRGGETPLFNQSIRGCIRDISINKSPLDLSTSTPQSNSDPLKARPGCEKEEKCLMTSCQNGGVCVANWTGPTCRCEESYTGENCSQASAATFNGQSGYSLIHLDRTKFSFGEEGSLEFRTRKLTSTLMLLQFFSLKGEADNFIEFRVYTGKLQVTSSFSQDMAQSNSVVSDGQWHSLIWVRNGNSLDLKLDSAPLYLQAGFDPYQLTLSNMMQVFIGARPYYPGNTTLLVNFLKGCMKGISFDNVSIPFSSNETSQLGLTISAVELVSGCNGDAMCGINSCPAHAYCVDDWNSFSCPCLEGWQGSNCTGSVDDCKNNSCKNGGTCVDRHLSYACQCQKNFTGQFCETNLEACIENPCHVNNTVSCVSFNVTDYKCNCLPGYGGKTCDSLINNCHSLPCVNNATCRNDINNFTCICQEGFSGTVCEIEDYCYSQPCFNGGTCLLKQSGNVTNSNTTLPVSSNSSQNITGSTADSNNVSDITRNGSANSSTKLFICQCVKPYFGTQCQSYDYCETNLCQNNATCVPQSNNYTCQCLVRFYGVNCENKDFCASRPCLNGGRCNNSGDLFTCICPIYYTGTHCETPVSPCLDNHCLNGAACFFNTSTLTSSPSSSSVMSNDSTICVCKEGYTGKYCETPVNKCESSPCLNNGTCIDSSNQNSSVNVDTGFLCVCMPGFQGDVCDKEVNECLPQPCQNGGVCTDLVNNFTCRCPDGFSGTTCNMDLRGCRSSPCQNQAKCAGIGANYTCLCSPGFTGLLCEVNIDDCLGNKCTNGGACNDGINNYTCNCLPGYSGQYCTNITDSCYTQPCINGGVCSYQGLCSCADIVIACGWHNETCQMQRCAQRPDCKMQSPSYLCNCSGTGYTGPHCAEDFNECDQQQSQCQHGGACVNMVGSYTCDCTRTGYHGNLCDHDDDECGGQNPCFNGGTCFNIPGNFECVCLPAWEGRTCGQNKNDCLSDPCHYGGQCIDQNGGYSCNCNNTGYEGVNCSQNVDDCVNNRCENGGQCVDEVRQYLCLCNGTGYMGQFCQVKPTSCQPSPCQNNGTCSEVNDLVTCNCSGTGFNESFCEFDIDECETGSHQCHTDSVCVNVKGSYYCRCGDSWTGRYCDTNLTQEQTGKSGLSQGAIAALIIISILVVIAVILLIIWQVRKRQKTRGRYKPAEVEGQVSNGDIHMNRLADRRERVI